MPIMTLDVPVEKAVVVSTLLGMVSTSWLAWHLRRDANRPLTKRLALSSFVGMPLGLWILNVVSDRTLRLALGIAVLIATALLVRRINLAHVGPGLDVGAGFMSGVLNTSLSTNGPPGAKSPPAAQRVRHHHAGCRQRRGLSLFIPTARRRGGPLLPCPPAGIGQGRCARTASAFDG
jgi:hypothetical protein